MQPDQAANELTEEQVPNFLINTLDERMDIELGENGNVDSLGISSTSSHSRSVSASNPRFSVFIVIPPLSLLANTPSVFFPAFSPFSSARRLT